MIEHEAIVYATCALRCFGFILSLPFGEALGNCPRFFLAVGLGVAITSSATVSSEVTPVSLLVDFVVGFALGAPLRFVSDVCEMVGELIDTARGQTLSSVIDPLHGQGGSDLAIVAKNGAIAVALYVGALEVSLEGLVRSVQVIPLGVGRIEESLARGLARSLGFLVVEGLRASAVWMGCFLLIDLISAFCSRLLSGLSFTQVGGVVKMVVTFLLVVVLASEGGRVSISDLKRVISPWRILSSTGVEVSGAPRGATQGAAVAPKIGRGRE